MDKSASKAISEVFIGHEHPRWPSRRAPPPLRRLSIPLRITMLDDEGAEGERKRYTAAYREMGHEWRPRLTVHQHHVLAYIVDLAVRRIPFDFTWTQIEKGIPAPAGDPYPWHVPPVSGISQAQFMKALRELVDLGAIGDVEHRIKIGTALSGMCD